MLYNQIIERCCYAKVGNCLNAAEEALLTAHARVQELEGKLDKEYLRFEDLATRKAAPQSQLAEKDREIDRLKAINKNDREYCSYEKILETGAALDVVTEALKIAQWSAGESRNPSCPMQMCRMYKWAEKHVEECFIGQALYHPAIAKRQKELDAMERVVEAAKQIEGEWGKYIRGWNPVSPLLRRLNSALSELDAVRGK